MKVDRLVGILSVLLQQEITTAPYLAELFEVSRRTIQRDIESLCQAGIPIVTKQGTKGGISVMENYRPSRTLLNHTEMKDILAGLRSLDSVSDTNHYMQLMEKLSAGGSDFMAGDQSVLIDLSSWYKSSLVPKIKQVRTAIGNCLKMRFYYYSPKGESMRTIEPYYLIFRWSSWYVWGWCEEKQNFRLFKLNRMEDLILSKETFIKRNPPLPDLNHEKIFPGGIAVKALFTPECKWRLIEEFGRQSFEEQPDGRLLFQADYTDKENLITWILTFGNKAELTEPEEIRRELGEIIQNMGHKYRE